MFEVTAAEIVFWGAGGAVVYALAGYPALVGAIARMRRHSAGTVPAASPGSRPPAVSVVLCVHNEATRVVARLENLLAANYPADRCEVIVVSDGSTDATAAEVTDFIRRGHEQVRLHEEGVRRGKASALNAAVALATGEIVVFADARQRFDRDAVRRLVGRFAAERVGAVSGALEIAPAVSSTGTGVDIYWRLEKAVRASESALGATIGCTGAIYAIRRQLFRPLPADTILDDVVVPMHILAAGFEVAFEPGAVAYDQQALEPQRERIRKQRTLGGNYQMFCRHPAWLLPWRNRAWWQLLSHKYLRLAMPWLLLAVIAANVALTGRPLYRWALAGQAALYGLACCGLAFPRLRSRMFSVPAGFVFLNLMALAGLRYYLRGVAVTGWAKSGDAENKTGPGGGREIVPKTEGGKTADAR